MSEPIWDKFLTERDKAVFAAGGFRRAGWLRQAARAGGDRRQLAVLRRQAGTDPGQHQTLAQFLRRGKLGAASNIFASS